MVKLGGIACRKLLHLCIYIYIHMYIINRNQRPIWVSLMWILEKYNDITLKRGIANLGRSHRLPCVFSNSINFHKPMSVQYIFSIAGFFAVAQMVNIGAIHGFCCITFPRIPENSSILGRTRTRSRLTEEKTSFAPKTNGLVVEVCINPGQSVLGLLGCHGITQVVLNIRRWFLWYETETAPCLGDTFDTVDTC